MLALLVLNLGATGFVAYELVWAGWDTSPSSSKPAGHAAAATTAEISGPVFSLDPFVVNLNEPGSARYLRVNLQLELANPEAQPTVQKSLLLIRDTILTELSGLRLADTLGSQAKEKLRSQIIAKITAALGSDKVHRVFFQEFVVQ